MIWATITAGVFALGCAGHAVAAEPPIRQPAYERVSQAGLPQSRAPLWTVLRKAAVGEDDRRGVFTISFPTEVRALDGRLVTLTGFMLPLDAQARSRHFLLSRYTPVCFFCPPGEPNEVVEVTTAKGVEVTDRLLTVSGKLGLVNRGDVGLFFQVTGADVR